jgi:hypothetical protein
MPLGGTDILQSTWRISSPAEGSRGCLCYTTGPRVPSVCEWAHSCCRGRAGWHRSQEHRGRNSGQSKGDFGPGQLCSQAWRTPGMRGRESVQAVESGPCVVKINTYPLPP